MVYGSVYAFQTRQNFPPTTDHRLCKRCTAKTKGRWNSCQTSCLQLLLPKIVFLTKLFVSEIAQPRGTLFSFKGHINRS